MDSYHSNPHVRALNDYHLELSMVADVFGHIVCEMDGPEWMTSAARIAQHRLAHLVENFPFPPLPSQGE